MYDRASEVQGQFKGSLCWSRPHWELRGPLDSRTGNTFSLRKLKNTSKILIYVGPSI